MNTNQKGKLTELQVLTKITEMGYPVSIPFGNSDRYDQIWDINGKLIRIQIKTSHWKTNEQKAIIFSCKSTVNGKGTKYSKKDIDYFATFWNNEIYLVPVEECSTEKTLWFQQPNGGHGFSFAKDYIAQEVLKNL